MTPTLVLDVVGLSGQLIGDATPNLRRLSLRGAARPLATITPAVTCSVQATLVTGLMPRDHGIVGNGWYYRDLAEVLFWKQSAHLLTGERVWDAARARDSAFTCAKLFWWYNMYDSAEWAVTPRPMYPADGRKLPDVWTEPAELRDELTAQLGTFPLFNFWGPRANLVSSRWIADSALHVCETRRPTLTLLYLPHLDYCLQKYGPASPAITAELSAIDGIVGELLDHVERRGHRVIVLSEYGITPVSAPIHVNRCLRQAGLLRVRNELGRELLDAGASEAFAVADHQVAHVYVRDPKRIEVAARLLEALDGVEQVHIDKSALGLDHPRSGELVLTARADRWFSYYYWLDDEHAPDFARCVDIHRKPGYDPAELFLDPALKAPMLKVGWTLARSRLGFRTLLDVIPLDAQLVRGSHGRPTDDPEQGPVFLSSAPDLVPDGPVHATQVKDLVLRHVFE